MLDKVWDFGYFFFVFGSAEVLYGMFHGEKINEMALWECFEYGLEQVWIFWFFLSIECGPGMSRYFLVIEYGLKQVWIVRYLIFSKLFESTEMTLVPVASVEQSSPIIALCHSQILELGSISWRYVVDKEFSQLNSLT